MLGPISSPLHHVKTESGLSDLPADNTKMVFSPAFNTAVIAEKKKNPSRWSVCVALQQSSPWCPLWRWMCPLCVCAAGGGCCGFVFIRSMCRVKPGTIRTALVCIFFFFFPPQSIFEFQSSGKIKNGGPWEVALFPHEAKHTMAPRVLWSTVSERSYRIFTRLSFFQCTVISLCCTSTLCSSVCGSDFCL